MPFQHEIYLASYDADPGTRTGYWDSPYYAANPSLSDTAGAARFDGIMSDSTKIPAGSTVRLLPGVYRTAGHPGGSGVGAWSPQNGMKIVGSGLAATTLQLVNVANNDTRYAIAIHFTGSSLDGFELSDLTIDCGLPAAGTATTTGAVRVRGRHIYIHRVKVMRYGTKGSAVVGVITAAGDSSENCVISECTMEPPPDDHIGVALLYSFEGAASHPHRFCVIRNCAALGLLYNDTPTFDTPPPVDSRVRAISPGAGVGTIIEGNQIANCSAGVHSFTPAKDIVIWNNYFRNVWKGIAFENNNAGSPIGRLILTDNFVELATASGSLANPIGIELATNQSATQFKQVTIRKNIVRDVLTPSGTNSNLTGIDLSRCGESIIENNVLSNIEATKAARFTNCPAIKFFNNQDQGGKLLRGYDTANAKHIQELEDAVQDVLLPL